jgi:hypothetical protein
MLPKFSAKRLFSFAFIGLIVGIGIAYSCDFAGFHAMVSNLGSPGLHIAGVAMAGVTIFPTTPEQMAINVGYRNTSFIADLVSPRVPVLKREFKWLKFDKRDSFTIPDAKVGRKGEVNFVEFPATDETDSCDPFALADLVEQEDLDSAQGSAFNPLLHSGEELRHLIATAREKRVADLLFNAANWTLKTQLAGNHQWNVTHADSDPIEDINVGLDSCLMRPNAIVFGQAAWTKFRTNANIVKAVNRSSGDKGMATRQDITDLFELSEGVHVGQAWANTANKKQTAVMSRLWGKHCLLLYIDRTVKSPEGRITYGYTANYRQFGGQMPDATKGALGGIRVQQGEYVKEKIVAVDCGYFIQDCIA